MPSFATEKRRFVFEQPIGVAMAITPWNFLKAMTTRKAAPFQTRDVAKMMRVAEALEYGIDDILERKNVLLGGLDQNSRQACGKILANLTLRP